MPSVDNSERSNMLLSSWNNPCLYGHCCNINFKSKVYQEIKRDVCDNIWNDFRNFCRTFHHILRPRGSVSTSAVPFSKGVQGWRPDLGIRSCLHLTSQYVENDLDVDYESGFRYRENRVNNDNVTLLLQLASVPSPIFRSGLLVMVNNTPWGGWMWLWGINAQRRYRGLL